MEINQIDIGKRLTYIRERIVKGIVLTIPQFASLIDEPAYNIANYESGKSGIPNRVLVALYNIGINPIYILTGEGSEFTDTAEGIELKRKFNLTADKSNNEKEVKSVLKHLESELKQYSVRAGNLLDALEKKKK